MKKRAGKGQHNQDGKPERAKDAFCPGRHCFSISCGDCSNLSQRDELGLIENRLLFLPVFALLDGLNSALNLIQPYRLTHIKPYPRKNLTLSMIPAFRYTYSYK